MTLENLKDLFLRLQRMGGEKNAVITQYGKHMPMHCMIDVTLPKAAFDVVPLRKCVCIAEGPQCGAMAAKGALTCTKPPGHDGEHVACVPTSAQYENHYLKTWIEDDLCKQTKKPNNKSSSRAMTDTFTT